MISVFKQGKDKKNLSFQESKEKKVIVCIFQERKEKINLCFQERRKRK